MEGMRYHRGIPYDELSLASPRSVEDTRVSLLEAAIEVFLEKGYQGARVQEIARRAGVTTGAIYANFDNKADLLAEAVKHRGLSALTDMAKGLGSDVASLNLVQLVTAPHLASQDPTQNRLVLDLLAMAARDEQIAETVKRYFDEVEATLRERLSRAAELKIIDGDLEIAGLVDVMRSAMLGALVARALGLEAPDEDKVRDLLSRLVPRQLLSAPNP